MRIKHPLTGIETEANLPQPLAGALGFVAPAPALPLSEASLSALWDQTGKHEAMNKAPGLLVIENAMDELTREQILAYAKQQKAHRSGLMRYDNQADQVKESFVDTNTRDTFNVPVQTIKNSLLRPLFWDAITRHIEPFYKLTLEWWEEPQLLLYGKGGKYEPHVDADYWVQNPDGTAGWKRINDRDLSILFYLNDDFTGGVLSFPDYQVKLRPKPGMLVVFPSSKDYRHGVEPTESGERLVLVSWASALGVEKVRPQPPTYPVVWRKEFD